jgi:hypothetical protein
MPPCAEKLRLLIAYQKVTGAHCDAVSNLVRNGALTDEYQHLNAIAEKCRLAAQQARDQLNSHIGEHKC